MKRLHPAAITQGAVWYRMGNYADVLVHEGFIVGAVSLEGPEVWNRDDQSVTRKKK